MAFLKRLSNSLWDMVSPQKPSPAAASLPTPPQSHIAISKVPTKLAKATKERKASLEDIGKSAKSMSPIERVQNWQTPDLHTGKRKRLHTPSSDSTGRRVKQPRIEVEDMDYAPQTPTRIDQDGDAHMDEEYEEFDDRSSRLQTPSLRHARAGSPASLSEMVDDDDDDMSVDHSLVVDDEEYTNSPPRKISRPEELNMRHISTEELRTQGWDDDYITLIQKIGMRGYEPVLPAYMKFEYRFLPDGLFDKHDDAFISSHKQNHFRLSKELEKLIDLGGRVRDRKLMAGNVEPEEEVRRTLNNFIKWAEKDASLDRKSAIPILAQEYQPADTPGTYLISNAEEKCRRLAQRWKTALRVHKSVEFSPGSRTSNNTTLSYELPTFYAIAASYTLVGLLAYRPDTDQCTPMAYFDFKDKDYDVWNSLALAIIVAHVRNVQVRIAEETWIGVKQPEIAEMEEEDPDL